MKVLNLFFIIVLIANQNSFAKECEEIDIVKDPNGSLSHFKEPQNQMNLGICYANSLALGLEAEIGKPVSYLQLATFNGKSQKKDQSGPWINSGNICETFNNLKEFQTKDPNHKLCYRSESQDENTVLKMDGKNTFKILEIFYDTFNKEEENHQEIQRQLLGILSQEKFQNKELCQPEGEAPSPLKMNTQLLTTLEKNCVANYMTLKETNGYLKKIEDKLKRIKSSLIVDMEASVERNFRNQLQENEALILSLKSRTNYLEDILEQSCDIQNIKEENGTISVPIKESIRENVVRYGADLQANPANINNSDYLKEKLSTFIDQNFREVPPSKIPHYDSTEFAAPLFPQNIFVRLGISDFSKATAEKIKKTFGFEAECLNFGKKKLEDEFESLTDEKLCHLSTSDTRKIKKLFKSVMEITDHLNDQNSLNDQDLLNSYIENLKVSTNVNKPQRDYIEDILGGACEDGLRVPSKLNCEETNLSEIEFPSDVEKKCEKELGELYNSVYSRYECFKKYLKDPDNYAINFRKKMLEEAVNKSLSSKANGKNGKPLMINICATFLSGNSSDAITFSSKEEKMGLIGPKFNCQKKIKQGENSSVAHSYHGVTLIGKKCENGKLKYLIQNSWGPGCSSYNKYIEERVECIEERGALWIDEDTLIKNTLSYQQLK